ncbi:hypothetical protein V1525DRAFT_352329 [Lipomyces kononenkoae]|uniref:Uncharacterized protein n=1 Tax=Lipomyces kononenkoae TaxID=34357 RepID=A0ACC3TBK8_LIPKO
MSNLNIMGSNQQRRRRIHFICLLACPIRFLASCHSSSYQSERQRRSNNLGESYIPTTTTISTTSSTSFSSAAQSLTTSATDAGADVTNKRQQPSGLPAHQREKLLPEHIFDHVWDSSFTLLEKHQALPRDLPACETTTEVSLRSPILSNITDSGNSRVRPVLKVANQCFTLRVLSDAVNWIDDIVWDLLHRTDTFDFPPSIGAIRSSVLQRHPSLQQDLNGPDKKSTCNNMSDFLNLLTHRLAVQQERFLEELYCMHTSMAGNYAVCSTECLASHIYGEFFAFDRYDDYTADSRQRYLQYAALWRHVAEEIDLDGPHVADEWWSLAELKFKAMAAQLRNSRLDEKDRYLQRVLDED